MPINPLDAYQSVERATLSGRELEASVLTKAAMQLQDVRNNWNAPDLTARLDEALRYNQKLWTYLQTELARPENPLPAAIKDNLLSLSAFVDKRTFQLMAFPVAEQLDVLININKNIAAGLRGEVGP
jgi:flagellar protein FlaF